MSTQWSKFACTLFVIFFVGVVCASAAKPDFDDVKAVREKGKVSDFLRISGTMIAGRHGLERKSEYRINILGAKELEKKKRQVLGPFVASLDLTKKGGSMKPGETRDFTADLSMKWSMEWGHKYYALSWMEQDFGLGVGGPDTVVLFVLGGGPDKVACTDWIALDKIYEGPISFELAHTKSGAKLNVTLQIVPGRAK